MFYLIHTSHYTRPFLTSIAFIARDFREWGYCVDCHPLRSKYIAEIRLREQRKNRVEWRIELMEIWARETISRRTQSLDRGYQTQAIQPISQTSPSSQEDRRVERASSMTQDFIDGIASFVTSRTPSADHLSSKDNPNTMHTPLMSKPFFVDPRPLPPSPLGLISKYMRLLHAIRYSCNAALPTWSNPAILIADKITLEFRFHEALKKEHLVHALNKAVCKNEGRMGRVEKDTSTGITKVVLFVDVGDIVMGMGGGGEVEERDPVPVYERVEGPPAYVEG
ncbi:Nn.00g113860.m01.CDS01 [Neocucurbitaria sp. VM-36]